MVKVNMNSDFFKFEDEDIDFPFYDGNPLLSLKEWAVLALGIIVYVAIAFGALLAIPGFSKDLLSDISDILPVVVLLLAVFYCCHGKLGLVFKKPKLNDFKVIILCFIGYLIFSAVMNMLLGSAGLSKGTAAGDSAVSPASLIIKELFVIVGMVGEELFKFAILIMAMAFVYGFTKNRKTSVAVGIIVCCIVFGLLHLRAYGFNIVVCLLIGGIGCVIHLYPYLKTKNLSNSYITHVLIDSVAIVGSLLLMMY